MIIVILYGFARLPEFSPTERQQLAQRFNFSQIALPDVPGTEKRIVQQVNPSLKHIYGWDGFVSVLLGPHPYRFPAYQ
ncbi:MAG: hypothetical protein ABFS56_24660 [Pseudomonadota bacterium]